MRWEAGEYDAPVTPDRRVFRQNVVGRTSLQEQFKETLAGKCFRCIVNLRSGGGGRTSSPPRVVCLSIVNAVKLLVGLRGIKPRAS